MNAKSAHHYKGTAGGNSTPSFVPGHIYFVISMLARPPYRKAGSKTACGVLPFSPHRGLSSPLKNLHSCRSRGNETQISLGKWLEFRDSLRRLLLIKRAAIQAVCSAPPRQGRLAEATADGSAETVSKLENSKICQENFFHICDMARSF